MKATLKTDGALARKLDGAADTSAPDFHTAVTPEMLQAEKLINAEGRFRQEFQGALVAYAQGRFDDAKHGFATVGNALSRTELGASVMKLASAAAEQAKAGGNNVKHPEFKADAKWLAELDHLVDIALRQGDKQLLGGALYQKFIWTGDTAFREQSYNAGKVLAAHQQGLLEGAAKIVDAGTAAQTAQGGPKREFSATDGGTDVSAGKGVLGFRIGGSKS